MGPRPIQTTYNVYGHLFEDNVDDSARVLAPGRT